jgi:hypothetical protein
LNSASVARLTLIVIFPVLVAVAAILYLFPERVPGPSGYFSGILSLLAVDLFLMTRYPMIKEKAKGNRFIFSLVLLNAGLVGGLWIEATQQYDLIVVVGPAMMVGFLVLAFTLVAD